LTNAQIGRQAACSLTQNELENDMATPSIIIIIFAVIFTAVVIGNIRKGAQS
jgi:hypothetical protein